MIHLGKLQSISLLFVHNLMSKNKIPGNIYDFKIKRHVLVTLTGLGIFSLASLKFHMWPNFYLPKHKVV